LREASCPHWCVFESAEKCWFGWCGFDDVLVVTGISKIAFRIVLFEVSKVVLTNANFRSFDEKTLVNDKKLSLTKENKCHKL